MRIGLASSKTKETRTQIKDPLTTRTSGLDAGWAYLNMQIFKSMLPAYCLFGKSRPIRLTIENQLKRGSFTKRGPDLDISFMSPHDLLGK